MSLKIKMKLKTKFDKYVRYVNVLNVVIYENLESNIKTIQDSSNVPVDTVRLCLKFKWY